SGKTPHKVHGYTPGKIKKKASPKRSKELEIDAMKKLSNEFNEQSNVSALKPSESTYSASTSKTPLYQKNSDSQTGVPVKETFHRAKRQLQALVG
ncbi:hypothetical protein J437_LFUL002047, partial [Ladona fulva]